MNAPRLAWPLRSMACATRLRVAWPLLAAALLGVGPSALHSARDNASLLEQWLAELCGEADRPMFSSSPAAASAAARPVTTVTVLSCEPLPDVPGKSVTTTLVDFPPGALTGPHRHPGSVTAVVLEGTVRSRMEGGPAIDYRAGQTWFEPPRALHLLAENPDPARAAKLLAVFVVDHGCGPLTIPEPTPPAS